MLLFLKKKTDDADTPEQGAAPVSFNEFLPYYCHFDPHTLLTKNGELLQIIKITGNASGRDYENGDGMTVREAIRTAITESIDSDKFALWVHTVRKRKSVRHAVQFKEAFAAYVHNQWQQKNHWRYQYYNEVYVTILHEGQSADLFDRKILGHVFLTNRNRRFRNAYLETARSDLSSIVSTMLEKLRKSYDATLLSAVERAPAQADHHSQPIVYSEPMEFLGQVVNLRAEHFPLPQTDMSAALLNSAMTFGFNALETKSHGGKRRFGAVLTLKQYREIPPETVDRVLQAPMELIVSETFNFIPAKRALKQYEEQKTLFDTNNDEDSIRAAGIDDMLASNKGRPVDFGEHQISIMLMADDYRRLDEEVAKVQTSFGEVGLITIREDIKLEECFWSQLPGNFEFIRRSSPINTAKIGGLCRLNRFASGIAAHTHWGSAVTVVPTVVNSPYFFNFHQHDNGHTLIFDFNSFNDAMGHVLLNFLLAETRKYDGRLYLFDRHQSARLFFDKLGGDYHVFSKQGRLQLDPFTLENNARNQSFLLAWCGALITPRFALSDPHKNTLRAAIEQLYAQPPESRHLPGLVEIIAATDPALANAFSPWLSGGAYSGLLDAHSDTIDLSRPVHAFDMDTIVQRPECIIPVFSYLLHRLIAALDDRPTIIVLHEAWDLLENAFFAPRLESLLEMLKQRNAMVIFTTGKPFDHSETHSFNTIMQGCATRLYVPDDIALDYASAKLGLDDSDAHLLRKMERQKGDFLLKQNNECTALRINVSELDDIRAIFANDVKHLAATSGKFAISP